MNPFQVIWEPFAWRMLHVYSRNTTNKHDFEVARLEIQELLGIDPHSNGTALSEGLFKLIVHPLAVCYSIDTPKKQVLISNVYETA